MSDAAGISAATGGSRPATVSRADAGAPLVIAFAVLVLLVVWTAAEPFPSLRDRSVLGDASASNEVRKYLTLTLAGAAGCILLLSGRVREVLAAVQPSLLVLFLWFGIAAYASPDRGLALNRLGLAAVAVFLAMCMPLIFARARHFVLALGIAATVIIAVSYIGVVFFPEVSIHSQRDLIEPQLAGNWRGIFGHKNMAGSVMVVCAFIGLLIARTQSVLWGAALAAAAFGFIFGAEAKSATLLWLPSLAVAAAIVRTRSPTTATVLIVGALLALLTVTVGSVLNPLVAQFVARLPDPTYTGRTDIWSFALAAARLEPIFGYGYFTFWDTDLLYSVTTDAAQAVAVSHSHNGYLDALLGGGWPGVALLLWFVLRTPLRDIATLKSGTFSREGRALFEFFVQLWVFAVLISCLESVLFNRSEAVWFSALVAVMGLRFWAAQHARAAAGRGV